MNTGTRGTPLDSLYQGPMYVYHVTKKESLDNILSEGVRKDFTRNSKWTIVNENITKFGKIHPNLQIPVERTHVVYAFPSLSKAVKYVKRNNDYVLLTINLNKIPDINDCIYVSNEWPVSVLIGQLERDDLSEPPFTELLEQISKNIPEEEYNKPVRELYNFLHQQVESIEKISVDEIGDFVELYGEQNCEVLIDRDVPTEAIVQCFSEDI